MYLSPQMSAYIKECQEGILADIVLGNPKAECRGNGICRMHIGPYTLESNVCEGTSVLAFVRVDKVHSRLLIHFLSSMIDDHCAKEHFGKNELKLTTDFAVPEKIIDRLSIKSTRTLIKAGTYPLLDDGVFSSVSVRLDIREIERFMTQVA